MTCEIAVFNKQGIAVAADSAVTLAGANGNKIFNSSNKLFTLSKYEPVGVMIYNNSSINGTPIELLIKKYRNDVLKDTTFNTLEEYCNDFFDFLNKSEYIKDQKIQNSFEHNFFYQFLTFFTSYLMYFKKDLANIDQVDTACDEIKQNLLNFKTDPSFSDATIIITSTNLPVPSIFLHNPKDNIPSMYERLYTTHKEKIAELYNLYIIKSHNLYTSNYISYNMSGIAIMGYGKDDFYPKTTVIETLGCIYNSIKIVKKEQNSISNDNNALIKAFAQSEMIHLFMDGILPEMADKIDAILNVPDYLKAIEGKERKDLSLEQNMLVNIRDVINNTQRNNASTIVSLLASLNKDEMLNLAKSLVELQALKKTVSHETPSVGGPIDIAYISKYDGFIWIKRKLYFDKDLNHCFFQNYYK